MSARSFDSLQVGEAIPAMTAAPISRTTLALYAGASGDHNPIHVDIDFAKEAGMDDVFAHGMLVMSYLARALTDWVPQSSIRNFGVRFTSITQVRDVINCAGRVVEKTETDSQQLIRVELQAANQNGDIKLVGDATIAVDQ